MYTATVSAKGWVVIPKDLRERFGLHKGTRVQIVADGDSLSIIPVPEDPVEALRGVLAGGTSLTQDLLTEHARERSREDQGHEQDLRAR